ncbi:hypothetical protein C8A01DRAFT_34711 [Parachaetomium inaequale]|uniref:Uncharacterized protein n=1 Tax=Parachaetomium inaequale TaxID=2588326 RepID=A0AAN6SSB8_9PEZI|nr:hypothetical protein C8A01DRAFT_34711 [Parachaetomium inaequale]
MNQFLELGLSAKQIEEINAGLDHDALNSFAWPMEWEQYQESSPVDLTFQEADLVTDMVEDSDMVEETHMTNESDDGYPEELAITPRPAEEADDDYDDAFDLSIRPEAQPDLGLVDFDHSPIVARHAVCLPNSAPGPFPEINDPIFNQLKALDAGLLVPYIGEAMNYQQALQSPVPELYNPIGSPIFGQGGTLQPFLFNGAQFSENQQLADQQLINLQPMQGFLDLLQQVQANPLSQVPFQMPPPMFIQNFFAANTINVSYDRRDQIPCQQGFIR